MKTLSFEFEKKAKANGGIVIEGYSNANVPDRMNDRVDPKGGQFDNYKKNPVVLFDHGKDIAFGILPVGKSVNIEGQDKGVYTKIAISNSKTEKISAVRDLVEEGILKMFSIGFDLINHEKAEGGVRLITEWEMLEQSIVPIPMNQDSSFSVSLSKRFKRHNNPFGEHLLQNYELRAKGAWLAAALHQRMYDLQVDREESLKSIASLAGAKLIDVKGVLAGELSPVPPKILDAFSTVLKVEKELLQNLEKGNLEVIKTKEEQPVDKPVEGDKPKLVVHSVHVPKAAYDNQELAAEYVEGNGYKASEVSETETMWLFNQISDEEVDLSAAHMLDLGGGCVAQVAPMKPKEEKTAEPPKEDEEMPMKKLFTEEMAKPGEAPAWVTDTKRWGEAKAASQQAFGDINHSFMVWWYVQQDGTKGTVSAETKNGVLDPNVTPPDDNPYLLIGKQTNVLLGSLIQEIQKMSAKLDGMVDKTPEQQQETAPPPAPPKEPEAPKEEPKPDEEDEEIKRYQLMKRLTAEVNERLKRLGV